MDAILQMKHNVFSYLPEGDYHFDIDEVEYSAIDAGVKVKGTAFILSKNLNYISNKENKDMTVKGNYKIAAVNFMDGSNTTKDYMFALFDNDITIEDKVLVDTSYGYRVAVVRDIYTKDNAEANSLYLPTKEVVCKVDFTKFDDRINKREKAARLKQDMDKKVKSLQEIAVFELLAEKSPELKEMLDEYKNLVEE